jgi:hypothetical protein
MDFVRNYFIILGSKYFHTEMFPGTFSETIVGLSQFACGEAKLIAKCKFV